ncbi:MAG: sensor histidine kinase [Gammaproteobacteria bacterium]
MSTDPKQGAKTSQQADSLTDVEFSAAEFDALLNAAVDGIIVTNRDGLILRMNSAAEIMFGFAAADVVGKSVAIIMNTRDARAHDDYMDNYMRTGERKIIGIGREVVAKHRDGHEFPVDLAIGEARVKNELRFVGLIRDLTRQKLAEEEALRQREQMNHVSRLTTMGEMAAAMAHELNQPLSAISNYTAACTRLLDQGDESRRDVDRALDQISVQAHRAAEIIQRMRDFARSRESGQQAVEIRDLILAVLPLARMDARANHVDLRIRLEKDLPTINADEIQIQQVLLNLVRNGIDAMKKVDEASRRLDLRVWMEDQDHVRIGVTDRGHGVSDQAAEQLFTPFFTTKDAGMGMGLAISRSIVTAHGGKLSYFNNPVVGATFFLILPTKAD